MRTTVSIDDQLFADLKRRAADTGRTMGDLIEDALRESLARRQHVGARLPVHLPTDGEGGLQPGVDLDDSAALLDFMEEVDRPR